MKISNCCKYLLSFPKTLFLNFSVFPLSVAVKLPVWVHYNVKLVLSQKECIQISSDNISTAMIKLGFSEGSPGVFNGNNSDGHGGGYIRVQKDSKLIFRGSANIARGFSLLADRGGIIDIGENFNSNIHLFLASNKMVKIGDNCLFGWQLRWIY